MNEKLDDKESTPEESKAFQYDINVLLDVNKFSSLRHLWKSHDRNLSNNLADNYDDVSSFEKICFLLFRNNYSHSL